MSRVSFGIIVLNGEPFVRYNLRALYPFAHEIIVVEGAVPAARSIASSDGHSTDGTLETLYQFQEEEDYDNKLKIIVRDGFWSEKNEQSQAYAKRASGNYLWQVDIDEFYHPEDMRMVLQMLADDPKITAVSFQQITFWGGFDYITDGWYLKGGAEIYHRLFKWGPGYQYVTHRPPTVHDSSGCNLRDIAWVNGSDLAQREVYLYHYSLLFPKQVVEKCEYYGAADWAKRPLAQQWAEEAYAELRRPYRVHNIYQYPSWLDRYEGRHPPQIEELRAHIEAKEVVVDTRQTDDIESLLSTRTYRLGRMGLSLTAPLGKAAIRIRGLLAQWRSKLRKALSR